jgi:hypothetical protein
MIDRLKEVWSDIWPEIKEFAVYTAYDFKKVWELYPNVLCWCCMAGILLFWM